MENDSYRKAGVDVTAGYRAVELMKKHVRKTHTPGVLEDIGGFGGLFGLDTTGISQPVLVSGTDGVGTKLRVAQILGVHESVGIDLVAMCVNDIICMGARPLFFLDYIATGKTCPETVEQIVSGIAEGCLLAGAALIGGETAEHPGTMNPKDYDLAGFCVGIADKPKLLKPENVCAGDTLIALASSGVHSNGFSILRRVFDAENGGLNKSYPELGQMVGQELLTPTRIYVKPVLEAVAAGYIRALAHITGGGFYENIPRALPAGLGAVVEKSAIKSQPIFGLVEDIGGIPERDMFGTFNMGVGMCAFTAPDSADKLISLMESFGVLAYPIGSAQPGSGVEII